MAEAPLIERKAEPGAWIKLRAPNNRRVNNYRLRVDTSGGGQAPTDPGTPPPPQPAGLLPLIGGDPDPKREDVREGKTIASELDLRSLKNVCFYRCKIRKPIWSPAQGAGQNVRFIDCDFEDFAGTPGNHGPIADYINNGHEEKVSGLVYQRCRFKNIRAQIFAEHKCSFWSMVDCEFDDCDFTKGMRVRHGARALIWLPDGFPWLITVRGHHHFIHAPGAHIDLSAGNRAADFATWDGQHKKGTDNNMQAACDNIISAAREVQVGVLSRPVTDGKLCKAERNIVAPGIACNINASLSAGTLRETRDLAAWLADRERAAR